MAVNLKKFFIDEVPKDVFHQILTQWDDGSLDSVFEDLLPLDEKRYPEEYNNPKE